MYLSEFTAENKVAETIGMVKRSMTDKGYGNDLMSRIVKDIKYKMYNKLARLSQSITEPLIIHPDTNWDTWMYESIRVHAVAVTNTDWDYDLYIAAFKHGDGYVIHTFTTTTTGAQLQTFFFDQNLLMQRIMLWEVKENEERKLFSPTGTNCLLIESLYGQFALTDPHYFDSINGSTIQQIQLFTKK